MYQTQSGSDKMKVIRKNRSSAGMVTLALAALALTPLLTQLFASFLYTHLTLPPK